MIPNPSTLAVSACFTGFGASTGASAMGWPHKSVCMALVFACGGATVKAETSLFEAIVQVETGGKPRTGANGELGPAQVGPAVLADLARLGFHFWRSDCFSLARSRLMFQLYTDHYIKAYEDTPRNRAAIWNGGPRGPLKANSLAYASRV